mmetsp:Transcript_33187/g.74970  ORF Transcript_33187/g.74970 Transcript_33187/m.74970 type:complete len:294 (+) Transcript_33187:116-997(+)
MFSTVSAPVPPSDGVLGRPASPCAAALARPRSHGRSAKQKSWALAGKARAAAAAAASTRTKGSSPATTKTSPLAFPTKASLWRTPLATKTRARAVPTASAATAATAAMAGQIGRLAGPPGVSDMGRARRKGRKGPFFRPLRPRLRRVLPRRRGAKARAKGAAPPPCPHLERPTRRPARKQASKPASSSQAGQPIGRGPSRLGGFGGRPIAAPRPSRPMGARIRLGTPSKAAAKATAAKIPAESVAAGIGSRSTNPRALKGGWKTALSPRCRRPSLTPSAGGSFARWSGPPSRR